MAQAESSWRARWLQGAAAAVGLLALGVGGCGKQRPHHNDADPATASNPLTVAGPEPSTEKAGPDSWTLPADLGPMPIPSDNPMSPEKVALGRKLFFDPRLSADGSRSCYSCHQNSDGNGGHDPLAIGVRGIAMAFHSPVIWNVGYLPALFWNGRANTLEEQATLAWTGTNLGVAPEQLGDKVRELSRIPEYAEAYASAFPGERTGGKETQPHPTQPHATQPHPTQRTPSNSGSDAPVAGNSSAPTMTPANLVRAIAAFERTLICDDTAYDRYARGDKRALDSQQKRGLEVFMGEGACTTCHTPPHFSAAHGSPGAGFFNAGIGHPASSPTASSGAGGGGGSGAELFPADYGRKKVTGRAEDWGAFKVPTLRNVSRSAPYFHDGSGATLEDAVRTMAQGGQNHINQSPLLSDKHLTDADIRALVRFLKALDCPKEIEIPTLPETPDGKGTR